MRSLGHRCCFASSKSFASMSEMDDVESDVLDFSRRASSKKETCTSVGRGRKLTLFKYSSLQNRVKWRWPVSQSTVTTVCPGPKSLASHSAPTAWRADDDPMNKPSWRIKNLAMSTASWSEPRYALSNLAISKFLVTLSIPMPSTIVSYLRNKQ